MGILVKGFRPLGGKHCWTTSLRCILAYKGVDLSEEMLFGLSGGLGFIYWHMKSMPAPFIGGRYGRGLDPLINTCTRIGGQAKVAKTTSASKGFDRLREALLAGDPPITFVDMVYLPYLVLPEVAHFGGHTVAVYGLDEEKGIVTLADRSPRELTVTTEDLKKARNAKAPPFNPQNKLIRVVAPAETPDLKEGILASIQESCQMMLRPPIRNIGLAGMEKWASLVPKWPDQFKGMRLFSCLFNLYTFIEISGTGGDSFRSMYAQYLDEASSILGNPELKEVAEMFRQSGKVWKSIASMALPDDWPTLARIRELMIEKNRIFEEMGMAAIPRMREISEEVNRKLIGIDAVREFREIDDSRMTRMFSTMRDSILELRELEGRAFERLDGIPSS